MARATEASAGSVEERGRQEVSWVNAVVGILGAIGILWGGYTAFIKARSESKSSAVAQWQELYEGQKEAVAELGRKYDALSNRVDASARREKVRDDYIMELRQHIAEGKPPPPPSWPVALLHQPPPERDQTE